MTELERIKEKYSEQLNDSTITDQELQGLIDQPDDSMIIHFSELREMTEAFSHSECMELLTAMMELSAFGTDAEFSDKAMRLEWNHLKDRLMYDSRKKKDKLIFNHIVATKRRAKRTDSERLANAKRTDSERLANASLSVSVSDSVSDTVSVSASDTVSVSDTDNIESTGMPLLAAAMTVPTADQITHYILENNLSVSPTEFLDYYRRRGWQGVNDWKQKLNEWDKRKP